MDELEFFLGHLHLRCHSWLRPKKKTKKRQKKFIYKHQSRGPSYESICLLATMQLKDVTVDLI